MTVTYDLLGRKLSHSSIDGGTRMYTYDETKLLYEDDAVMRRNGSRIDYTDGFGRMVKTAYLVGGTVECVYGSRSDGVNAAGKVLSVTERHDAL